MLQEKLDHKNIILASASPRRQLFLKELGLEFEVRIKEVEENFPPFLKRTEITDYLAILKAKPFLNELKDDDVLITADTIVWLGDKAIGKPKDTEDAKNMLKLISGKTHEVISSFCITTTKNQIVKNETTLVHFGKLHEDEINYYIKNFKPFDKAGSYGIQEWIGYIGIEKIEGSYYNVMGFPVKSFYEELKKISLRQ